MPFHTALTPFEFAPDVGRDLAVELFLRQMGQEPHTKPVTLEVLRAAAGQGDAAQ